MRLLIWVCTLCLLWQDACGIFFDLPGNKSASNDESAGEPINGLKQYFGINTRSKPVTHNAAASESSGFFDEVESSLEHATDMLDGLWQEFKKGIFSLMGGEDDRDGIDGHNSTQSTAAKGNVTVVRLRPSGKATTTTNNLPSTTTPATATIESTDKPETTSTTAKP